MTWDWFLSGTQSWPPRTCSGKPAVPPARSTVSSAVKAGNGQAQGTGKVALMPVVNPKPDLDRVTEALLRTAEDLKSPSSHVPYHCLSVDPVVLAHRYG